MTPSLLRHHLGLAWLYHIDMIPRGSECFDLHPDSSVTGRWHTAITIIARL
jgi:hypothetical protein